jgi:hypothetical protein
VFAATIERETHISDLASLPADQNGASKLQITFSYSDGFGREIQKKLQAEPSPVRSTQMIQPNQEWSSACLGPCSDAAIIMLP